MRRVWRYHLRRMARLKVSEHQISLGFAAGAFASFTPFVGFHFIIAAAIAMLLRGSLIASAVGTVVGNPFTFPLIWLSTYQLGLALLQAIAGAINSSAHDLLVPFKSASELDVLSSLSTVFMPMLIGSLPLGLACGLVCYIVVLIIIRKMRVGGYFPMRYPQAL